MIAHWSRDRRPDRRPEGISRAGALRADVTAADVVLVLEMVMLVELPGPDGGLALRRRYLALLLQALQASAEVALPLPAAEESDLSARWRARDRA